MILARGDGDLADIPGDVTAHIRTRLVVSTRTRGVSEHRRNS